MSIVLHGLGQNDVDSGSSIVAFGLARDLNEGETIEQAVASASITELFVIDYGGNRKLTAAEYRRYRALVRRVAAGHIQFRERKGRRGIEYFTARLPTFKGLRKAA